MQGYEEDLDEEAGYDDYYTGDEDEYEEEKEERKPPKEELEYLELRQKLKDSIRKNMGKGSANAQSSQDRRRKLPYNNFGSFFGPSQPVISSRVIQESKSLLENELRTGRTSTSNQTKKRPVVSTSGSGTKIVSHEKRPKVVNEVRRKVEALKDTRDYSFLLSDDAELPVPKKDPLSRSGSFPSSEARSAQLSARPKPPSGINGRTAHGPPREEKRSVSANGHSRPSSSQSMNHSRPAASGSQMQNPRPSSSSQMQNPRPSSGSQSMNHSRPAASGSQMQNPRPSSSSQMQNPRPSSGSQMQSRSVSGRPASSGSQLQSSRPASSGSQMQQRAAASSGSQRPSSSTYRQAPMRPPVSGQSSNRSGQPNSRSDSQRSAPAKVPLDHHRKQMSISSSNGAGPARSGSMARPLPSKTSLERKPSISAGKSSLQSSQRPSASRPLTSDPRQRVVEQRKVSRDPTTSRMVPKQSAPTSSRQMTSKPGLKRPPPRDLDDDRRPRKKKPARMSRDDDMALDMIRKMFKTDRFAGRDDDDRNMEANYEDIMKEERRSARIAREEDEREAQLLEAEEEEERQRQRKSRKLIR